MAKDQYCGQRPNIVAKGHNISKITDNYVILMTFRPNMRIRNQYLKELGPSATLRAIRMCLRPTVINRDNTPRSLISLGCASGINFTLGIIPQLIHVCFMFKCMNVCLHTQWARILEYWIIPSI